MPFHTCINFNLLFGHRVGIGPSASCAVTFVAAEGKHVHGLEASGCVRCTPSTPCDGSVFTLLCLPALHHQCFILAGLFQRQLCSCTHLYIHLCRSFDVFECPISALSDWAALEWSDPSKLRLHALETHHVLRAPHSSGVSKMSPGSLISEMGHLLRAAGTPSAGDRQSAICHRL